MLDRLIEFLNNISAGSALAVILVAWYAFSKIFSFLKNLGEAHKEKVETALKKKEAYDKINEEFQEIKQELETVESNFQNSLNDFTNRFNEYITKNESSQDQFNIAIKEFRNTMNEQRSAIDALAERISKIEHRIEILFKSDKEYTKAYITESYKKYVKEEKHIDLMTLQNIESIYNEYLEETGSEDEFLAKLMRELRNLPTIKEKKES